MIGSESNVRVADLERCAQNLEAELRLEEARDAYDSALRLNASAQAAAEGRARVALALKEDDAVVHCSRALAFHRSHPDRQLDMILTAAVELGSAATALFVDYIREHPENVTAHEMLAELRAQHGEGDHFLESYTTALSARPASKALLMSYWNTLTRAGRMDTALHSIDLNRSLFENDRDFALLEVKIASHSGLTERAGELLDRLDDRPDAQLARAQHRVQTGRPDEAARLLDQVIQAEPDNLLAWALLELVWRMLEDARHEWLIDQPGLYGASELAISSSELDNIAEALRALHQSRSQPLGQSVRGGTQTAGQLFLRPEPEIRRLSDAIAAAIRKFVDALPAGDPRHPLLKHRNMGMAFGPSWSVRFIGSGFHAAHFHPGGILSSACYISLPDSFAGDEDKGGWLEIGRPPPELGLDLPPLATFEPGPGRLVLFPSFLFHGTRPFTGGERLTVAFDLVPVPAHW